jgi:DNA primase
MSDHLYHIRHDLKILDWLAERGINPRVAQAAGIGYDVDREAIMYPKTDRDGNVVGHKLRRITGSDVWSQPAGIKNSDITLLCTKRGSGEAYICEGETDALAFATAAPDIRGSVFACPGASTFTHRHAEDMERFASVVVVPDGDKAGRDMVRRIAGMLDQVYAVAMPDGHDVCSYLTANGTQSLSKLLRDAERVKVAVRRVKPRERLTSTPGLEGVILDLANEYGKPRPRSGEYAMKCPFHQDSEASLMISEHKNVGFCFGCGWKGGPVKFLMDIEDIDWRTAKEQLARRYGQSPTSTLF